MLKKTQELYLELLLFLIPRILLNLFFFLLFFVAVAHVAGFGHGKTVEAGIGRKDLVLWIVIGATRFGAIPIHLLMKGSRCDVTVLILNMVDDPGSFIDQTVCVYSPKKVGSRRLSEDLQ